MERDKFLEIVTSCSWWAENLDINLDLVGRCHISSVYLWKDLSTFTPQPYQTLTPGLCQAGGQEAATQNGRLVRHRAASLGLMLPDKKTAGSKRLRLLGRFITAVTL